MAGFEPATPSSRTRERGVRVEAKSLFRFKAPVSTRTLGKCLIQPNMGHLPGPTTQKLSACFGLVFRQGLQRRSIQPVSMAELIQVAVPHEDWQMNVAECCHQCCQHGHAGRPVLSTILILQVNSSTTWLAPTGLPLGVGAKAKWAQIGMLCA